MAAITRIAILDYGMGNLRSVEKALARVGADVIVTSEAGRAQAAAGLVLPGVGAFPKAMARVRDLGLDGLIHEAVAAGTPVLGICLGMQLLFERSSELGGAEGLRVLDGDVTELDANGLKLPHIGWENVHWERPSSLTQMPPGSGNAFYFVHSFAVNPSQEAHILGTAVHGTRFVCAVGRDRVWGLQFHPEKSGGAGLDLLATFVAVCA